MKIREGAYYLTRGGAVVGPMRSTMERCRYPWMTSTKDCWTIEGEFSFEGEHDLDLISEVYVSDTPQTLITVRTGSSGGGGGMSDIVENLRQGKAGYQSYSAFVQVTPTHLEAANEIERLQAENVRLREALEKLARLGAEPYYGNSDGNMIARAALGEKE